MSIAKSIIIATIILAVSFLASIVIKLPPAPLPSATEIKANAKAEQQRMTLQHEQQIQYTKAQLELEKARASRPITAEEVDAQTISVPEHIGLKLLGF